MLSPYSFILLPFLLCLVVHSNHQSLLCVCDMPFSSLNFSEDDLRLHHICFTDKDSKSQGVESMTKATKQEVERAKTPEHGVVSRPKPFIIA